MKQNLDLLSDCSLTRKNLLCSEIATYLQVKDSDEHRDTNQESQVSPASSLPEFAGTPEQLFVSKTYISNTQNDLNSVNEAMQVDESSALSLQTEVLNKFALFVQTAYSNPKPATRKPVKLKSIPKRRLLFPSMSARQGMKLLSSRLIRFVNRFT